MWRGVMSADPALLSQALARGMSARERFQERAQVRLWRDAAQREAKARKEAADWYRTGRKWAMFAGFLFGLLFAFGCAWLSGLMLVAK